MSVFSGKIQTFAEKIGQGTELTPSILWLHYSCCFPLSMVWAMCTLLFLNSIIVDLQCCIDTCICLVFSNTIFHIYKGWIYIYAFHVYVYFYACLCSQSSLTLCDPVNCSPSGSSIYGILQTRILEWIAISYSRGSSWPRDWTCVSCIGGRFFTTWPPEKPHLYLYSHHP